MAEGLSSASTPADRSVRLFGSVHSLPEHQYPVGRHLCALCTRPAVRIGWPMSVTVPRSRPFKLELQFLARARSQMHAAETAQSLQRKSLYVRKTQIKLHNFVSRDLAGIGHRYLGMGRIAHLHWLGRQRQPAAVSDGAALSAYQRIHVRHSILRGG
jgi:hypothetical protein